tara:strand:- start:308 stop:1252 length:945 start_codon:yes stop_codon:yes gene_type:complete
MANERHTDYRAWDIDSSTRQSVHPANRYVAISNAASTTAEDIYSIVANGGEKAVNWVTNPGVEGSDVTMYTATGSAIARDTGQQAEGAASLLVNPANSAAGEGFYWESPTIPFSVHDQYLSVQLEHRGASASGAVTLTLRDTAGTTIHGTSGTDNLAASWRRLTATYLVPGSTDPATYRLYLLTTAQHNINFYADKIMFEVRQDTTAVSTYLDGNQTGGEGPLYEWTGTANASTSIKKPSLTKIKGFQFTNRSATAADIIYLALDQTATSANGIPIYGGDSFNCEVPLDFRGKISMIAAQNTPTLTGVVWGIAE